MAKPAIRDSLGHDAEYVRERKFWYGLIKGKGFHDIEKDDGSLESVPERFELNDNVRHERSSVFELISVDVFAAALHRYNFKSAVDHRICEYLAVARTFKDIKAELGVGQERIERVRREVKSWHDTGSNLLSDVEQ